MGKAERLEGRDEEVLGVQNKKEESENKFQKWKYIVEVHHWRLVGSLKKWGCSQPAQAPGSKSRPKKHLSQEYSLSITGDYRHLSNGTFCKASLLGYGLTILSNSSLSNLPNGPSFFPLPLETQTKNVNFLQIGQIRANKPKILPSTKINKHKNISKYKAL